MLTSRGDIGYELEGFGLVFRLSYLDPQLAVSRVCQMQVWNVQQHKKGCHFV